MFSCRRIVLKVFLVHFVAFQATYAAPSPIIRFPGDDSPKTDKEVALVSSRSISRKCPSYLRPANRWHRYWMVGCFSDWLVGWVSDIAFVHGWCFSFSTIWISFMDAHKTDATSWCSRTRWRKCKSSSLCKKPEKLMPKLWKSWKSLAAASQMWPITTSSIGSPCGRRKTSHTGQPIHIPYRDFQRSRRACR